MQSLMYGLSQFPLSSFEVFSRLFLLVYLTEYLGLKGQTAGLIISVSLLISIIFDPIIGKMVDSYKNLGKRISPIIIFAIFGIIISLILLFIPNWNATQSLWLFFILLLYQICYSLFLIPYLTLAKVIVKNSNDTTGLYAWRYLFGSLGAILGVSLPFLKNIFPNHYYESVAITSITIILLISPITIIKLRERKSKTPINTNKNEATKSILKSTFKNRVYMMYLFSFLFLSIGLGINQTMAVFYYKNGLNLTENETNKLIAIYMLIFCFSIPFWTYLTKSFDKKKLLCTGLGIVTACTLVYPTISSRDFITLYCVVLVAGIGSGVVALLDSYLGDIIDLHSFKTKYKQGNFLFGIWRIIDKLSRALGIYLAGLILDLTLSKKIFSIKDGFGYFVFACLSVSLVFLILLKFNNKKHKVVQKYLTKKRPDLIYSEV